MKMKTGKSPLSLQDERDGVFEKLRGLDPQLCFVIGLISSAVIGYYIPTIVIALTGVWVNSLYMLGPLLSFSAVLVVQNLIGNRLNRLLLVSLIFLAMFYCLGTYFIVSGNLGLAGWRHWWMALFQPTVACPLSAWLLLKFKEQTLNR